MKTTEKKFRNPGTVKPRTGEVNSGEEKVVKGQAFSVRELIEKFANGVSPTIAKNPIYLNPENFEEGLNTNIKDLTDIDEMKVTIKSVKDALKTGKKNPNGEAKEKGGSGEKTGAE